MDKQKVNTTSSMNRKGYSSSSHYRINPVAEESEQVLAIKFVQWDVPSLESLCNSKVCLCTTNCHLYHKDPCPKRGIKSLQSRD